MRKIHYLVFLKKGIRIACNTITGWSGPGITTQKKNVTCKKCKKVKE